MTQMCFFLEILTREIYCHPLNHPSLAINFQIPEQPTIELKQ